ncbi:MAG TPA: DUF4142 domain-containing protein [Casimicrobiaceae bacterium]|nr:DUF4142 domain-containing protein [Casimicrobiaceae bacterium]
MSHARLPMPAWIAGVALLVVAAAVGAQTPATGTNRMGSNNATAKATAESVSDSDRKFMEKAARGGMAEVELGKLAAEKAGSADVKQFGQRMVDDHSKANDKLKALATSKGVNLPTGLDRSTQREMDKLSKLSGAEFDREYMKHMVSDHKKDVSEFKSEAKKAKDADVKSFAASTLPTLEEHLKLAQSTEQAAKKEGKAASAPSRPATTSSRAATKAGS